MKTVIFLFAILLAGCAQYSSDDDLDTRPVTNNIYRNTPSTVGAPI